MTFSNKIIKIKNLLKESKKFSFSLNEIIEILQKSGITEKEIADNSDKIIKSLAEKNILEKEIFINNRGAKKYVLKNTDIYSLGLSINPKAYLSHYTAVFLHELTNNIPKIIYVNTEQSESSTKEDVLTQTNILKAMHREPRISQNLTGYKDYKFSFLQSRFSDNLGIEEKILNKTKIKFTNIERTLIDIAVSPYYCGGIYEVFNVYKNAKGLFSSKKLADMLKQLKYIYPYHQVIGLYLEKSGYEEKDLELFENFEIKYKFFAQRMLKPDDRNYSDRWKLFYPKFI